MLSILSSVLGLGSSIAGFFGSSSSDDGAEASYRAAVKSANANLGLAMAAAREKAQGYKNSQYQSNFAGVLANLNASIKATQTTVNADIEAENVKLSAGMQAIMYRLQGALDGMEAEFVGENFDKQAQRARALGQEEAFEIARQLEFSQGDFQAQAAASGFQATDDSSIGISSVSEDLEAEGRYQQLMAMARGEQQARDIGFQGDIKRSEGRISGVMNELSASEAVANARYTANSLKRVAKIESKFYRAQGTLEASARKMEADGYKGLAAMAISYGRKADMAERANANAAIASASANLSATKSSASTGAWSTLLGGAASFAGSMPQSGLKFPSLKFSSNSSGVNYG